MIDWTALQTGITLILCTSSACFIMMIAVEVTYHIEDSLRRKRNAKWSPSTTPMSHLRETDSTQRPFASSLLNDGAGH